MLAKLTIRIITPIIFVPLLGCLSINPNKVEIHEYGNIQESLLAANNVILLDEPLRAAVTSVMVQLKNGSGLTNEPHRICILNSTAVNAYSSAAGTIYLTTGMLAILEDENELAAIVAHELAHYYLNHSLSLYEHHAEGQVYGRAMTVPGNLLLIIIDAIESAGEEFPLRFITPTQIATAYRSRYPLALELEADSRARVMLEKANYSELGLLSLLEKLELVECLSPYSNSGICESMQQRLRRIHSQSLK